MAHRPVGMLPEEAYEEWLGRMDINLEDYDTIEQLKDRLTAEIGEPTDAQLEMLWAQKPRTEVYSEHGIRAITIEYPWGTELRYGIQGMPGLWGWSAVQEIREGEEW